MVEKVGVLQVASSLDMNANIRIRPVVPADLERCTNICFDAFGTVNARHGFPPELPTREVAVGLMKMCFANPQVYGVAAEDPTSGGGGRVIGSCFLWEMGNVAGIGPVTVDPTVQARRVGRQLMESVLARARADGVAGVRLVQAAFNTQSMSLYAKLGFDVREPLVLMNGDLIRQPIDGYPVRKMTSADVDACVDLCYRVHGHDRRREVEGGLEHGTAALVERAGRVVAYATDIGFFAHAVSIDNAGMMALISGSTQIAGPGLLVPSRNGELFRWCLSRGLRVVQPMTLMTVGLYNEPQGAFLPSILF